MCPVFLRWGRWWIGRQRSRRGGSWLLRRCRSDCRRCGDRCGGTHGSVQSPIIVIWIIVECVGLLQIFFVGESARLSRRHFPARLPEIKISHINSNSTRFQLFWDFSTRWGRVGRTGPNWDYKTLPSWRNPLRRLFRTPSISSRN